MATPEAVQAATALIEQRLAEEEEKEVGAGLGAPLRRSEETFLLFRGPS